MERDNSPTYEELRDLYEAAVAFKHAACWKWMYNNDIFGVVNPETGEIAYCCIMGNGGKQFGVVGYLGAKGLNHLNNILIGDLELDYNDMLFSQNCLMASFEDRTELKSKDLKMIKELGLTFRGRMEWPLFRRYEPGKPPWFLNSDECRFLTYILTQALEVSLRCQKNHEILEAAEPGTILMRVYEKSQNGEGEWSNRYLAVESYRPQYTSISLQDEIRLRKIKKIKVNPEFNIEANTSFLPTQVKGEGKRPYFPKACLYIDHQNGMVLSAELIRDIQTEGYKFLENLLQFIEQNNRKPAKILVQRDETYYLLNHVCKQIGVKLEKVKSLLYVEEFLGRMYDRF